MLSTDPTFDMRQAWLNTLVSAFEELEDPEGAPEGQDGETGSAGETESTSTDDASGGATDDVKNPRLKELSDEAAKRRVEAKAEKDRADALAAKLREYEDKDKSELEKAQRDAKELGDKVETLEAQLSTAQLELSFFRSGAAAQLQDPADALKFLDLTSIKAGDDGTLPDKEVLAAVNDLLKRKPYLAKSPGDNGDGPDDPSGRTSNSRKGKKDLDRQTLEEKFPALKGR